MQAIEKLKAQQIHFVFCDIDDTLTDDGQLHPHSYSHLWQLHDHDIKVIPVTGRPAGWCEMIARMWPVHGVIGENGAFYFVYDHQQKKMRRHFAVAEQVRQQYQTQLKIIEKEILLQVPGAQVASDQFCRLFDLAIDFCEDVPPLASHDVEKIANIARLHGATAKISSIHVNTWFGQYDKLTMCQTYCQQELGFELKSHQHQCAFIGDSPNDEPMFAFFDNSVGVANIQTFIKQLQHPPQFVTQQPGGHGFSEFAQQVLKAKIKIT